DTGAIGSGHRHDHVRRGRALRGGSIHGRRLIKLSAGAPLRRRRSPFLPAPLLNEPPEQFLDPLAVGRCEEACRVPAGLVEDTWLVAERLEAFAAMIGPDATRADAAEGHVVDAEVEDRFVDGSAP